MSITTNAQDDRISLSANINNIEKRKNKKKNTNLCGSTLMAYAEAAEEEKNPL